MNEVLIKRFKKENFEYNRLLLKYRERENYQ